MEDNLEWQKKTSPKNELSEKLELLIKGVVMTGLNDINSKIESLCAMGVIKESAKLEELRDKMKQLRSGIENDNSK